MKVLAISNSEGCVERIADVFESTEASIVAKEEKESDDELFGRVSEAMGRGSYDYAIVVAGDHVAASISLNKFQNIRAALCDNREDMRLARSNGANVIIVRADQRKLDYLAAGVERQKKRPEKPAEQERAAPERKETKAAKEEKEEKMGQAEDEPDLEGEPRGGGKGIMGKLKDSLGIVDESK